MKLTFKQTAFAALASAALVLGLGSAFAPGFNSNIVMSKAVNGDLSGYDVVFTRDGCTDNSYPASGQGTYVFGKQLPGGTYVYSYLGSSNSSSNIGSLPYNYGGTLIFAENKTGSSEFLFQSINSIFIETTSQQTGGYNLVIQYSLDGSNFSNHVIEGFASSGANKTVTVSAGTLSSSPIRKIRLQNSTASGSINLKQITLNLDCSYSYSEDTSVTGVTLNSDAETVTVGDTVTLVETISPSNAENKNVTWTSSDESVATVEDGVVTGVAEGEATITVTTEDGGYTATCDITVEPAESFALTGVYTNTTKNYVSTYNNFNFDNLTYQARASGVDVIMNISISYNSDHTQFSVSRVSGATNSEITNRRRLFESDSAADNLNATGAIISSTEIQITLYGIVSGNPVSMTMTFTKAA